MLTVNLGIGIFGIVWGSGSYPYCELNLDVFMLVVGILFILMVSLDIRAKCQINRKILKLRSWNSSGLFQSHGNHLVLQKTRWLLLDLFTDIGVSSFLCGGNDGDRWLGLEIPNCIRTTLCNESKHLFFVFDLQNWILIGQYLKKKKRQMHQNCSTTLKRILL